LIAPLLHWLQVGATDETSIIDLAGKAAIVLPSMLIVAAIMSQFSAAVADTVGAGGLLAEESAQKLSSRLGYLLVAVLAIVLVWTFDIFEIIALASRAFAAYYLVQSLVALVATRRLQLGNGWAYQLMFGIMAVGLSWIVVFGKSVG
jgi:hypothetical protein